MFKQSAPGSSGRAMGDLETGTRGNISDGPSLLRLDTNGRNSTLAQNNSFHPTKNRETMLVIVLQETLISQQCSVSTSDFFSLGHILYQVLNTSFCHCLLEYAY